MEHRQLFGRPQMLLDNNVQSCNMHFEEPYGHTARGIAGDDGSFLCTIEDTFPEGVQFASSWSLAPISDGYAPICHNDQLLRAHPNEPGPYQDPFVPQANVGTFDSVPENYFLHASSSNYNRPMNITRDGGRAHQKRKNPEIPAVCGGVNTSRYCCDRTSSDIPSFYEFRQDMLTVDAQNMAWHHLPDSNPGHRDSSLSARSKSSLRNVRSRRVINFEHNLLQNHSLDNPALGIFTKSEPMAHPSLVEITGPRSSVLMAESRHVGISPAHGRFPLPGPCEFTHELTDSVGGSNTSAALPCAKGFTIARNPDVPRLHHGFSNQSPRDHRTVFSHRPTLGPRLSNSRRLAHASLLEERLQLEADSHSRHPSPLPMMERCNGDRTMRSRITNERYWSCPDEASLHGQIGYEGFITVGHPGLHASRSTFDRHEDMRLNVDNMSYEDLLELGERIGTVSTGLSEDSMSKCLKKTIHSSRGQLQDEDTCVICLEAYRDADKVGTLKTCAHRYHVSCIKKWLSIKNSCPICKAPALPDDDMKDK